MIKFKFRRPSSSRQRRGPVAWIGELFDSLVLRPFFFFYDVLTFIFEILSPSNLFRGLGWSVSSSLDFFRMGEGRGRELRRWWNLVWGGPALVFGLAGIALTAHGMNVRNTLGREYWERGVRAVSGGDFAAAELYLQRAKGAGGIDKREIAFALAATWDALGYTGRAMETFQALAPADRAGFPKAHRHLAMGISMREEASRTPDVLKNWLWHLRHADAQESPEMQQAWGMYYLATNNIRGAIQAFAKAATTFPQLYLTISRLHGELGNAPLQREALTRSKEAVGSKLTANPSDRNSRIVYATTLLQLGELNEAESVLKTGIQIDPDGPYSVLLASLYVHIYDKLRERGEEFHGLAIQQLRNSLNYEPEFQPALARLLGYAQVNKESIGELREILEGMLVNGEGSAIAHLALSNLAWLEGNIDQAGLHLDQAMRLDNQMPVIANNFAWLLAHQETPNLDRAFEIVDAVVSRDPENPRYLDTRGTVLLKLGKHREALVDLEKALPNMPAKGPVHLKIAEIYRELGVESLASQHEAQGRRGG